MTRETPLLVGVLLLSVGCTTSDLSTDPQSDDATASVQALSAAATTCGNGVVEFGEECDDGNTANGDGCSSTCFFESPRGCDLQVINNNTNSANVTKAAFCSVLFRLDSTADDQFYDPQLDANTITVDQLFAFACNSPEFASDFAAASDNDFVNKLYLRMLYRVPSASEVNFWLQQLVTLSRATVCQFFSTSPELNNRLWPMLNRFRQAHGQPTH